MPPTSRSEPPITVTAPARAALWRAGLAAPLLALAAAVATRWTYGAVVPADVLFGAALGLLAGPLVVAERAVAMGRARGALAWACAVALLGTLAAAVQGGYAARALAAGTIAGAQAAAYADVSLALLDPLTLRVALARAAPLALVPLLLGAVGRAGGAVAVAVPAVALAVLLSLAGADAERLEVRPAGDAAWSLPTGPRSAAPSGFPHGEGRLQRAVLVAALLDAAALALAAALADRIARRRARGHAPSNVGPVVPGATGLALAALVVVGALAVQRGRPPAAWQVPALVDALDHADRRWMALQVLLRLGPSDADAVAPLAAELTDVSPRQRVTAARLLAQIGPPGTVAAVDALGRALADQDPDVRRFALDAIAGLGSAARPAAPALLRATLATRPPLHLIVGAGGQPITGEVLSAEQRRCSELLTALGYELTPDDLLDLVGDADVEVARGALQLLLERPPATLPPAATLRAALQRPRMAGLAFTALLRLGDSTLAALRDELQALADRRRAWSEEDPFPRLLEHLPPGPATTELLDLARRHPVPQVRALAARAHHADRPGGRLDGSLATLMELLMDRDPRVLANVKRSLLSHGRPAIVALAGELAPGNPRAAAAADVLSGAPRDLVLAAEPLARALREGQPPLRRAAARAAAVAPNDAVLRPLLVAAIGDEDPTVATTAIRALAADAAVDEAVRARMVAALDAPMQDVRLRAALALAPDGHTRVRGAASPESLGPALPRVVAVLADALPDLEACMGLRFLGPLARDATPALVRALDAGPRRVDVLVTLSAVGLEGPGVIDAVRRTLRAGAPDERRVAARALGVEPRTPETVAALVEGLRDPDPDVRRQVARSLEDDDLRLLAPHRPALEAQLRQELDAQTNAMLQGLLRRLGSK